MKNWACILIAFWVLGCGSNAPSGNLPKENYTHPQSSDNLSLASSECTTDILAKTAHLMDSIGQELILEFLESFKDNCQHNAEFSQWSNELLFEITSRYPELLLSSLSQVGLQQKDRILREFSNPVSDVINLDSIIHQIEGVMGYSEMKIEVLSALGKDQ